MTSRRLGILLVLGGSALALAIQIAAPVVVPLYDGVQIAEPYRYLRPASGQVGNPTSANVVQPMTEGISPVIVAATTEIPPQAQLIAQRDAFVLTQGATSITATITPIDPPAPPAAGPILGNAYRFTVADQLGTALRIRTCDGCVSIAMRAPDGGPPATIMRFEGGAWTPVVTRHGGAVALYQTNPMATGVYAVVATGASGGIDVAVLLGGAGIALIFLAFIALLFLRARPATLPVARIPHDGPSQPSGRVPSKRRGSRRPPSGRSGS